MLKFSTYINVYMYESCDTVLTNAAEKLIEEHKPDFVFLYMVETDEKGGHDRTHGADIIEDMTIPLFFYGPDFTTGENISNATLLDIAPTIVDIMGINPVPQWEGNSLVNNKN